MYDIHTHLYDQSYDADREAVLARARALGIEKMIVVGCTIEESRQAVELTEQNPELYASIGIHPHFFNEFSGNDFSHLMQELKELAKNKKVVAIGECGLDYYSHDKSQDISLEQKILQKEGFLAQIEIARELKLPLIVHTRPSIGTMDAYEDVFDLFNNHSSIITHQLSFILHCYQGDAEMTKRFLALPNVYFSFTANITYPVKKALMGTKDDLSETVKMIPLERMFTETDCPFLAPQDKRGERNEPAYVVAVVERIATLHGVEMSQVDNAIKKNVEQVFGMV